MSVDSVPRKARRVSASGYKRNVSICVITGREDIDAPRSTLSLTSTQALRLDSFSPPILSSSASSFCLHFEARFLREAILRQGLEDDRAGNVASTH